MKEAIKDIQDKAKESIHMVYHSGMKETDLIELVSLMVVDAYKAGQLWELLPKNLLPETKEENE